MSKKRKRSASASRRPAKTRSATRRAPAPRRAPAAGKKTPEKARPSRSRAAGHRSMQAARYLWAAVSALVIAALLFEPTMVWTLGVGVFMIAAAEFSGLWLVVSGYGLACLPAAFGLLIATGRFWTSLTHALWIGAVYSVVGFIFFDRIFGILSF